MIQHGYNANKICGLVSSGSNMSETFLLLHYLQFLTAPLYGFRLIVLMAVRWINSSFLRELGLTMLDVFCLNWTKRHQVV